MRAIFYIIFIFIATICQAQQGTNHDQTEGGGPADTLRNVYWVHGLGGAAQTSWTKAGDHIEANAFKVKSFYPGYSETDLAVAGSTLLNTLNTYQVNPKAQPPIAIGHSQGGLVIRSAELRATVGNGGQPIPFGGIATFATPHAGAAIIANVPEILNYLQEGCEIISKAHISELVETNFLLDLFLDSDAIQKKFGFSLCEFISQVGAPALLGDFLAESTKDFVPEAPFLNTLNDFPSALNNVVFYGEEEDPVFFRVLSWLATSPESVSVYTANEDEDFIGLIDSYRMKMFEKTLHYQKLANNFKYWLKFNSVYLVVNVFAAYGKFKLDAKENRSLRSDFRNAYNWIGNIDDMWKELIGVAGKAHTPIQAYCECREYEFGKLVNIDLIEVPFGSNCEQHEEPLYECKYIERSHFEFMEFDESDGVISVTTAQAFPGASIGDVMQNSNHQQLRNDKNTEYALEGQLFSGKLDDFFKTSPK